MNDWLNSINNTISNIGSAVNNAVSTFAKTRQTVRQTLHPGAPVIRNARPRPAPRTATPASVATKGGIDLTTVALALGGFILVKKLVS